MMQEVVDQILKSTRSQIEGIHTALPGEIKSYDTDKGLAVVQPKIKYTKPDGSTLDYPEISGVPVVFPQSKSVTIAWPVKQGDGCLLVVSERSLDYWMYGSETDTQLLYDLSNAIAIMGISPKGNSTMKTACDDNGVAIAAGSTKVKITPDTTKVEMGGTTLTVTSSGVTIAGNLTVKGGVTVRDDVKSSNGTISLNGHKHIDSMKGNTTAPVP